MSYLTIALVAVSCLMLGYSTGERAGVERVLKMIQKVAKENN